MKYINEHTYLDYIDENSLYQLKELADISIKERIKLAGGRL